MSDTRIIDACRTPRGIGKAATGALAGFRPQHLAAAVLRAIAERNGLETSERRDPKRGLVTMCAAGGTAPAIVIERL